ncbi:AAA family ATPase [Cellulomonas endophytica]|uniref:AAA family ATPase n=1 Tax=Cellulomonas endophytica TaxID=2494735 RepID=UPI001F0BBFCC|nr:AAA family ATPase [Cellulomonas endophytica]
MTDATSTAPATATASGRPGPGPLGPTPLGSGPSGSVPWRVTGLLAPFVAAGVLAAADVHVARRLVGFVDEHDERVALAAALTVRALRGGSVCLPLDAAPDLPAGLAPGAPADARPDGVAALAWPEPDGPDGWHAALRRSPLVADGPGGDPDRPLRWVDGRLYLDRYWRDERVLRDLATEPADDRADPAPPAEPPALEAAVADLLPAEGDGRQREAVRTAARRRLTVLTGGPGTGKTTTVARLVAALEASAGPGLRVALAAPTGKAAARLQESVGAELRSLGADRGATGGGGPDGHGVDRRGVDGHAPDGHVLDGHGVDGHGVDRHAPDGHALERLRATTLHRLLGPLPGTTTRFRHDRHHRLPHDLVVVDESSMVSLPLMARLLEALRPTARLVLVGDPDQLSSVDAGAVLADLVEALPEGVVRLTTAHRYGEDLAALAEAVRRGDGDEAVALLRAGGPHRSLVVPATDRPGAADVAGLRQDVVDAGRTLRRAARSGDAAGALAALERHRLLLAHREGPHGVAGWAALAERWVEEADPAGGTAGGIAGGAAGGGASGPWPLGTPLLVTENDRAGGLANGDTGVVVADGGGGVVVAFGGPAGEPVLVPVHRLPPVQTVHAMTVHRAQGSQFRRVSVLLPPPTSPLLTRELLYTAVTRARDAVRVIGSEDAVRAAVARPVRRASGLRTPLVPGLPRP